MLAELLVPTSLHYKRCGEGQARRARIPALSLAMAAWERQSLNAGESEQAGALGTRHSKATAGSGRSLRAAGMVSAVLCWCRRQRSANADACDDAAVLRVLLLPQTLMMRVLANGAVGVAPVCS